MRRCQRRQRLRMLFLAVEELYFLTSGQMFDGADNARTHRP
jgi:hypothetical protein